MLRGQNERLETHCFAKDGGEESEVAGVYIIDKNGKSWRIGFTTGNEFSDLVIGEEEDKINTGLSGVITNPL